MVPVKSETRICQTLLTPDATTELVEEAGPLSAAEVKNVARAFAAEAVKAKLVVLTGTMPSGCGDSFYARLVDEAKRFGVRVLIDAQEAQLLNAIKRRPFLVKINRDELAAATHVKADGRSSALRKLMRNGPRWVVISDGAKTVHVSESPGERVASFKPPRVAAKNPIGSGDAMMAGIAVGLTRGLSMLNAVRFGLACGAANTMTAEPGYVRLSDVRRLCWTGNKHVLIV